MNFLGFLKSKSSTLVVVAGMLLCCFSCISTDDMLGGNYITTSQLYDIYTADIPITGIENRLADSLSGYSRTRIGVGAIRDAQYGLSTRSCALTLVPVRDTMDFGINPQFKSFHFAAALDTISVAEKLLRFMYMQPNPSQVWEAGVYHSAGYVCPMPNGSSTPPQTSILPDFMGTIMPKSCV